MPGHWYSLSTELNPHWSTYYVPQPEIRRYWEDLWNKHDLSANTTLNTAVVEAAWDDTKQLYKVELKDTRTGKTSTVQAQVIVWAIGGFQDPIIPTEIKGFEV